MIWSNGVMVKYIYRYSVGEGSIPVMIILFSTLNNNKHKQLLVHQYSLWSPGGFHVESWCPYGFLVESTWIPGQFTVAFLVGLIPCGVQLESTWKNSW